MSGFWQNGRLLVLLLSLCLAAPLLAADRVSPWLASRVLDVLTEAEADPQAALTELARLLERSRNDVDRSFVLAERAALLIQLDDMTTARAEMAALLAGQPPEFSPRLRNLYATTLLADEDFTGALEQLQHWAAHAEPVHPHGLFLMGYACIRLERYDDAVSALERTLSSGYRIRDPWVELLAVAYNHAGRPEAAVALLEEAIARHPDRQRWWKQLAGIFMVQEQLAEGAAGLSVAQAIEPLSFSDQRRLARLYAHLGMPADGAVLLQQALAERAEQAEPPEFEELMLLAELWMLARETDLAIATFADAQALADQGEAALAIAQLHAQREEYAAARTALETAVSAYGEDAPARAYYLLAVVQINLGELQAAATTVERLAGDEAYQARAESLSTYLDGARER